MIRMKNRDFTTPGNYLAQTVHLGDVTASQSWPIFVAPYDCKVLYVDIYNRQTNVHNDSQCLAINVREFAGGSSLGAFAVAITAGDRNRITPTGNNSLTAGRVLELTISAVCATLSQVVVNVTYIPLKHRSTR